MLNLAGSKESDIWSAAELTAAGIEIVPVGKPYGEPQTRVTGKLGGITFKRAWYYWIAKGRVPLEIAKALYQNPIGRKDVRVAGHCGCPPPEPPWVDWYDGDEPIEVDPDGKGEAHFDRLAAKGTLDAGSKPRFVKSADGLTGYVTSYHIDSPEGLKLFADAMKGAGR